MMVKNLPHQMQFLSQRQYFAKSGKCIFHKLGMLKTWHKDADRVGRFKKGSHHRKKVFLFFLFFSTLSIYPRISGSLFKVSQNFCWNRSKTSSSTWLNYWPWPCVASTWARQGKKKLPPALQPSHTHGLEQETNEEQLLKSKTHFFNTHTIAKVK